MTVRELSDLCRQLHGEDIEARRAALSTILASASSSLNTFRNRLRRDLRAAPGDLQELLDELSPDVRGQRLPPRNADPPFDLLEPLITTQPEGDDAQRTHGEALEVVALLRALTEAESTDAARVVIQYGPRELGVFKAEIARDMQRLGDRAIPALLRTTQHPNEAVAGFATELLEWLRREDPGRQVQARDPNVLAEILTVYGELSDRDTIPVLLAFSGSEEAEVREAARASLRRYGRAILWPTRDKYNNFTGEEPSRSWGWEELSRRLFEAQDRARMAQAERTMEEGLDLAERGQHAEMLERYEKILARWPRYERRGEMVPGLLAYASELEESGAPDRRRELLSRALLLDPDEERAARTKARLLLDSVERGLARGVADEAPIKRLEADRHLEDEAGSIQRQIRARTERTSPRTYRLIAASGLLLFAAVALVLLALRVLSRAAAGGAKRSATKEIAEEGSP